MARFNANDADKYGGQGGTGFFSLKDDKDVARVRFMYDSADDVEGFAVHTVEIGDKKRKRYVNCLREYDQSVDVCPFCREHMLVSAKMFIPIYNVDEGRVQHWERGKKFISKISSICARYPHVVSHVFDIERIGKKNDTATTYEIYPISQDDTTLEDLPDAGNVLGTIVLDKSAEDMEYFLKHDSFPGDEESSQSVRRRTVASDEDEDEERVTRRTPSRRGDRF